VHGQLFDGAADRRPQSSGPACRSRTATRAEIGNGVPLVSVRTLRRLVQAYEREGIEFTQTGQGVRRRRR